MPTKTSLSIKSKSYADDTKTVTDNISYVNPNISNATALELAQRLNALTKNSYQTANRIDTTELTGGKTPITITSILVANTNIDVVDNVANVTLTTAQLNSYGAFGVVVGGTFVSSMNEMPIWESTTSDMRQFNWSASGTGTGNNNRLTCTIYLTAGKVAQQGTGHLYVPESDSFGELNLDINYTITEET